jgi:hypothetical protein
MSHVVELFPESLCKDGEELCVDTVKVAVTPRHAHGRALRRAGQRRQYVEDLIGELARRNKQVTAKHM